MLAEPAAYAWPQSVVPGESVGIHAAGPATGARVTVARIGARREVVWRANATSNRIPFRATPARTVAAGR